MTHPSDMHEIWLVHAPEIWPDSPEARRRQWTDALMTAILERDGRLMVRSVDYRQAARAGRGSAGAVLVHLHGDMPVFTERLLAGFDHDSDDCPMAFFGELTADHDQVRLLDEFSPQLILRGLPAPLWANELGAVLEGQREEAGSRLLPPLIPGWRSLPAACFRDQADETRLLVRGALGVAGSEPGSGLTAFEGPHRLCDPRQLVAELDRLFRTGITRAEVVDPEIQLGDETTFDWWLSVLDRCFEVRAWTMPIAELGPQPTPRIQQLRSAGVEQVRTRLVSASPKICRAMNAPSRPDSVEAVLQSSHAAGIRTELLLEVGAPGEGEEERAETVRWLRRNAAAVDRLVMRAFAPEPGSNMTVDPRLFGIWWVPGGERNEWVDRRGSNLTMRHKVLSELVVFARDLGIECEAPKVNLAVDVVRRQEAVTRRYHAVAAEVHDRQNDAEAPPPVAAASSFASKTPQPERIATNGPRLVEIELSAACNLRCVGCWCHSELLDGDRHEELQKAHPLPTERLVELLTELAGIGVEQVQLSGSGEPLMNRDVVDLVAHASGLGLSTVLVTNGVMLDADLAARLASAGLGQMTVSVWAGDAATYEKTHPGAGPRAFAKLTEGLKAVAAARARSGWPHLKLYHVISQLNFDNVAAMVDHSLEVGADSLELQLVDLVRETEAVLALKAEQVAVLEASLSSLRKRADYTRFWLGVPPVVEHAPQIVRDEVADFGRFLRLGAASGKFTPLDGRQLRCRRGLTAEGREGRRSGAVDFTFPEEVCCECDLRGSCFGSGGSPVVVVPTLSLSGVGSFLRRARAAVLDIGSSEAEMVRDLPCVVGDVYSRIDYRGNVVACCKGSGSPLGNVADGSFISVWQSRPYAEFRRKARDLPKDDPYFAPFGCLRSCDNLGMNLRAQFIRHPDGSGDEP